MNKRQAKLEGGQPSTAVAAIGSKKALQEMDTADQVLLLVDQMVKKMGEDSLFLTVTTKNLEALVEKINARLGVDSIKIFSQDNNTRGLAILQKLRDGSEALNKMQDLCRTLHATEGLYATADALAQALDRAHANQVAVAGKG